MNANNDRAATGKIAQLEFDTREGICQRLLDGWTGKRIIKWLAEQGITGCNEQNISNWRKSEKGYRAWLAEQERLLAIRTEAETTRRELTAGGGAIHDRMAIEFAQALIAFRGQVAGDPAALARLSSAAASIIRAATNREKLDVTRDVLALEREKFEVLQRKADQADQAIGVASNKSLTPEERDAKIKEVFGVK